MVMVMGLRNGDTRFARCGVEFAQRWCWVCAVRATRVSRGYWVIAGVSRGLSDAGVAWCRFGEWCLPRAGHGGLLTRGGGVGVGC